MRYPPGPHPEPFWPALLCVAAAIALQLSLPDRLVVGPTWLVPALEAALLVGLVLVSRPMIEEEHPRRRTFALALIGLVSAANIASLSLLTHNLLHHKVTNGHELIIAGAAIWLTNVLIFSLWYWQLDRGGPGKRASGEAEPPDFLFTQMDGALAYTPADWTPVFVDYLFLGLMTATAFSPTDVMPLSPMAKCLVGLQSLISVVTLGLIISRAVNIL